MKKRKKLFLRGLKKINQEIKQTDITDPANVSALILKYSPKQKAKTIDPDTGAETTTESLDIAMGVRLFKAAGGIMSPEVEALLQTASKKEVPQGAVTGIYKGKRAYQLNGKFYDITTGEELQ